MWPFAGTQHKVWHSKTNLMLVTFLWVLSSALASFDADLEAYTQNTSASLLWGPYRSNLYFGVRPRLPKSLLSGLMWYNADNYQGLRDLRHSCEQWDNMDGYGWQEYDPRLGGRQIIRDVDNNIQLVIDFVKNEEADSWAARISGKPIDGNSASKAGVVFYSGLEGLGNLKLQTEKRTESSNVADPVILSGSSPDLGQFNLEIDFSSPQNKPPSMTGHKVERLRPQDRTYHASLTLPDDSMWMAKDVFLTFAQDSVNQLATQVDEHEGLPPWSLFLLQQSGTEGKVHFVQRVFEGEFCFDVKFESGQYNAKESSRKSLSARIESTIAQFHKKFDDAFELKPPYNQPKYVQFGRDVYSQLAGGLGYFYGSQIITTEEVDEEDGAEFWQTDQDEIETSEDGPHELFSFIPSRGFFPRGFYWDEGFHLIPVLQYDSDLALDVMKSWLSQVDADGWIAREQILGPEARSKVPVQFQVQHTSYANPPTLLMLITDIAKKVSEMGQNTAMSFDEEIPIVAGFTQAEPGHSLISQPELLAAYIREIYPSLRSHYDWFRRSQRGYVIEYERDARSTVEAYKWRGRTPNHCLTSGLDDYPRTSSPHHGDLHVDLLSWVGMMARAMKTIAGVIGEIDDAAKYAKQEAAIVDNLDDLHWSDQDQAYCDVGIADDDGDDVFVCHLGYISLLPFALKLVEPMSPHLKPILDLVSDPDRLWTPYGIRSLSKLDPYFAQDENYWRGSVWVNINYLVLDALKHYCEHPYTPSSIKAQASDIYSELRTNLVDNVFRQWKKTRFVWEQYHEDSGDPKGVKNFAGWTSLIVSIMAMPDHL